MALGPFEVLRCRGPAFWSVFWRVRSLSERLLSTSVSALFRGADVAVGDVAFDGGDW